MSECLQVVTTVDSKEAAAQLARGIVEARLGACVQTVGPVKSTYHWQGRVETATEWQLVVKTSVHRYHELEEHIRTHHTYETPEIVAMPVVAGSPDYLAWVIAETRSAAEV
jgi:periplasmic divalent cation tolerance protein